VVVAAHLNIKCRSVACHIRYAGHTFSGHPHMNMSMLAPNTCTTSTLNGDNHLTVPGSTLCTLTDYKQEGHVLMSSQLFVHDSSF